MYKTAQMREAVVNDDRERVKQLLREDPALCRTFAEMDWCMTPLLVAAREGRAEVARILLENGADIETSDSNFRGSPLAWAAVQGHQPMVEVLLEKGANPNTVDRQGFTPLKNALDGAAGELRRWGGQAPRETYQAIADLLRQKGGKTPDQL